MTDRKIMTSAAAIFAATFATASLAQDALTNPEPGLGADGGQVQMDTSPEAGGLGGGEMDTTGTGTGVGTGVDATTGAGVGGATGLGTTDTTDGAGTGTVGGNTGTMTEGQTTPPAGGMGTTGAAGDMGTTGAAGDMGTTGAAGDMGTTGAAGAGMDAGATGAGATGTAGAAGGMGADGQGDWTYGSLISGMRTGADFSAELEGMDENAEIQIVRLSSFQGAAAENAQGLDEALTENEEGLNTGRDAVRENTQITEALEAEEFDADDVVMVRRSAEGTVEVIVDDRES